MPDPVSPSKILQYLKPQLPHMLAALRQFVTTESPSLEKAAVDRCCRVIANEWRKCGARPERFTQKHRGDILRIAHAPGKSRAAGQLLVLGHYDTVYPLGTLAQMPCQLRSGHLHGPGVYDMKSGIALMVAAIEALKTWHGELPRPLTVFLVSDEEVGSNSSRAITEILAKKSAAVLVCEPSYGPRGAVKTARKGIGDYRLKVTGKAAHAGLDFEKGQNAIVELAEQIRKISKFVDLKRGLTLSVGTIQGGTRVNVVPVEASVTVDVRIAHMKDAAGIDRKLRTLKPANRKCKLEVSGGMNRPPMERTKKIAELYQEAATIAKEMAWKLDEAAVGGGSDGNFTAALGIPTLDGLGGVGEGAHSPHESVDISALPRRAALLAGLLEGEIPDKR